MHHVGPFRLNRARLRAHGAMDARNDVSITDCFELGVRPDVSFVLVNLTGEDRTRKMKEPDCVRQTIEIMQHSSYWRILALARVGRKIRTVCLSTSTVRRGRRPAGKVDGRETLI
jgi:hypothetical protein